MSETERNKTVNGIEIRVEGHGVRNVDAYTLKVLQRPTSELTSLSGYAYRALLYSNAKTIAALVEKSEAEMLRVKHLGRASLAEIKEALMIPHSLVFGSRFHDAATGERLTVDEVLAAKPENMKGSSPGQPIFQFSDALTKQMENLSSVVTERFRRASIPLTQSADGTARFEAELQEELARRLDFAARVFDEPKGRASNEAGARAAAAKLINLHCV
jgi:hypothetical protein